MAEIPIAALKAISRELDALGVSYVFTGGSIVALLVDEPEASVMRPTDDIDVIVEKQDRCREQEGVTTKGAEGAN